jgi:hypothetical protein
MTEQGRWYAFGAAALLALGLLLLLWSILVWIGLGLLAGLVLLAGWAITGALHRRRVERRLALAEARKAEAEAAQQEAITLRLQAEAAQAAALVHAIPASYVGILLDQPTDRERLATWAQPRKVIYNGTPMPQIAGPVLEARPSQRAPVFAQAERDMIPPQLLLGYNAEGKPLLAVDKALRSGMLVLGRPGEGKSTVGRYWAALSLKYRFPVMVLDPHESILSELAPRFYTEGGDITAVQMAADIAWILDYRISLGEKYPHKFLLIIVDEWGYYQRTCPELVYALGRVILEGRKYRLCVQVLGHGFPGDSLGGTPIRDAICTLYVLGSSAAQAHMAGLESTPETAALLSQVKLAGPGSSILSLMGILPTYCSIPDTVEADLARLLTGLKDQKAIRIPDFAALNSAEERQKAVAAQPAGSVLLSFPFPTERASGRLETPQEERKGKEAAGISRQERETILAEWRRGTAPSYIHKVMRRASNYYYTVQQVIAEEEERLAREQGEQA